MNPPLCNRGRQPASVAAILCIAFAACGAMPPSPSDASRPPWMLRHVFPGWDGAPVEVSGAPGPRAVAVFLVLAMQRDGVARPEDLGDALRQIPSFYRFTYEPDGERWAVISNQYGLTWSGTRDELLSARHLQSGLLWNPPFSLLEQFSLAEVAVATNDVFWKWPRLPGSRTFLRPPRYSADSVGNRFAKRLRELLDRGVPLERAWQELVFLHHDELHVITLLPGGSLRVEWHPELDPLDGPGPRTWEGEY